MGFLVMKQHASLAKVPLKFNTFITRDVQNSGTESRFVDVLKGSTKQQRQQSTDPWPGYVMNMDGKQEEKSGEGTFARVLLGTPTGLAAGYSKSNFICELANPNTP